MRRVLSALAVVAIVAASALLTGASDPERSLKSYEIEFDNAFGLVQGGDLKIGGVKAGQTTGFRLTRTEPYRVIVTAQVDRPGFERLRSDAECAVRQQSLIGEYFVRQYRGHFYAKAQNLSRLLRRAYDDAFNRFDLLLMPTLPMKATPLPEQNAPLALYCQRGFEMLGNTCPFDVTGHPAMSIPCGMGHGLPIGLMLIAKHYNESTIYRAAHAFEQLGDWRRF